MNNSGEIILIEQSIAPEKTAGGIYIPDTAKEKPSEGIVVSVHGDSDIKIGCKIWYAKLRGTEIVIDGKEYLMLRRNDIFGYALNHKLKPV